MVSENAFAAIQIDVAQMREAGLEELVGQRVYARIGDRSENLAEMLHSVDGLHFELKIDQRRIRTGVVVIRADWTNANLDRALHALIREPRGVGTDTYEGRIRTLMRSNPSTVIFGDSEDVRAVPTPPPHLQWPGTAAVRGSFRRSTATEAIFRMLLGEGSSEHGEFRLDVSSEGARLAVELATDDREALLEHAHASKQTWPMRVDVATVMLFPGVRDLLETVEIELIPEGVRWTTSLTHDQTEMVWTQVVHAIPLRL